MQLRNWDKTPEGNVKCNPATRWEIAPGIAGVNGLVRIEYAIDSTLSKSAAVQLNFTASGLRDFISDLSLLAHMMDQNLARGMPTRL